MRCLAVAALLVFLVAAPPPAPGQGSPSALTTVTVANAFPDLQIANTSFTAGAGGDLTIRFNATTPQPGTLYWSIANGTGQPAFMSLFQIEAGESSLPRGVTATYPDGVSSAGSVRGATVVLAFAPSTAGKTIPLELDVWLVADSDPQHPTGVSQPLTVRVGPQGASFPLELAGASVAASLVALAAAGVLWRRKAGAAGRPVEDAGEAGSPGRSHARAPTALGAAWAGSGARFRPVAAGAAPGGGRPGPPAGELQQ